MKTETSEFVMGWHKDAVQAAQNIGLKIGIVNMPSGYADRLYLSGDYSKVQSFKTIKHLVHDKCLFSPGVMMPGWV